MTEVISIKRNVIASYAASAYAVLISIVMAPVYLSYMGPEAYGLIGFFTMMYAWLQLLDMGLTPTVIRETALFRGRKISIGTLRNFLRGLEIIFWTISLLIALALLLLTQAIATRWLKVENLSPSDVQISLAVIGIIIPIRWIAGLYRAVMIGFEKMTLLAAFNCALATLRFVGVLTVFLLIGVNVRYFFMYQLLVSLIDLSGALLIARHLTHAEREQHEPFSWRPLMNNTAFSLTIGLVTTISVILGQTDKLVLSKSLPLATFGIFSLAVAAASTINIAGTPLSQAVLPRLTKLFAEENYSGLLKLYGNATQTMSVIIYPAIAALIFFPEQIMRAWTGHGSVAHEAAPILRLYAIGNGMAAFNLLSYYIQYARGNLRLHFIGNAILLVFLIPAFIYAGSHYGGIGTGTAWAIANSAYFLLWVPIVHAQFLKGLHWKWLFKDVIAVVLPTTFVGWLLSTLSWPQQRPILILFLVLAGLLLTSTSIVSSTFARNATRRALGRIT